MRDPYRYFRLEARELVEHLAAALLELERADSSREIVARLLRHAHTLKGAARVVKQSRIADRAHAIEDALAPFRETGERVPRARIDEMLAMIDEISTLVRALDAPTPEAGTAPVPEEPRTLRADLGEVDALLAGITEVHTQIAAFERGAAVLDEARRLVDVVADQLESHGARGSVAIVERVRGDLASVHREMGIGIERLDRELGSVRELAEQLRLVPGTAVFRSLERTVRDVASTLHKQVVFEPAGGDVRLDAHVVDVVQPALVQILRNAVAHGIEAASERRAAGKPVPARVGLALRRRGRHVVFTCRDDGRGIDVEAVRRDAIAKGMAPPAANALDQRALLEMLVRSRLSTSTQVSEIAGRGIGLDVVRAAVERLDGDISISTEAGRGTTIEVVVPANLAAHETLLVDVDGACFAIPRDAVRGTMRVAAGALVRDPRGDLIGVGDELVSFSPLAAIIGGIPSRMDRSWSTVVVAGEGGMRAFGVDRLRGNATVVVRPLPPHAQAAAYVAGAWIDANGNAQLLLDPEALVSAPSRVPVAASPQRHRILVIDDSLTTRMLEQNILEAAGYDVDTAISAPEALERARHDRYSLFLVDVEMPGMDGFEFIEHTRRDATLVGTPSILVTSRSSESDRQRGREVGARGYIVKGEFDQVELLAHIARLVGT